MSMLTPPARPAVESRFQPPRIWLFSFAGLLALSLVSSATPPGATAPPPADPAPPVLLAQTTPVAAPSPTPASHPMDEPIRLITEAQRAYANVQDYSCTLIKKEKMDSQPPVENVMNMKVRIQPFSVNLRWLEPKALAGQEAIYVAGKNDGKMRVKSAGVLGAVGFISLEPNDARAQKTSKHAITEAGIGNLIERYSQGWPRERTWNMTQVQVAEYEFNKRRCIRVEATHPDNPDGRFHFYRNVVYFDKETNLPVRCECYDWPHHDGDKPELLEVYSYVNMQLNVGLTDDVFNK
jgi:hypothetical protein